MAEAGQRERRTLALCSRAGLRSAGNVDLNSTIRARDFCTQSQAEMAQADMTLIELMVVVAIVGILSAVAVVMVSRGPEIGMVANTMANEIGEASRKGVAAGPLDPAVIAAEGFTARSRVFLYGDSSTGRYYYAVEIRREDESSPVPASNWEEISRGYLPEGMAIAGLEKGVARTEPGSAVVTPLDPSGPPVCPFQPPCHNESGG